MGPNKSKNMLEGFGVTDVKVLDGNKDTRSLWVYCLVTEWRQEITSRFPHLPPESVDNRHWNIKGGNERKRLLVGANTLEYMVPRGMEEVEVQFFLSKSDDKPYATETLKIPRVKRRSVSSEKVQQRTVQSRKKDSPSAPSAGSNDAAGNSEKGTGSGFLGGNSNNISNIYKKDQSQPDKPTTNYSLPDYGDGKQSTNSRLGKSHEGQTAEKGVQPPYNGAIFGNMANGEKASRQEHELHVLKKKMQQLEKLPQHQDLNSLKNAIRNIGDQLKKSKEEIKRETQEDFHIILKMREEENKVRESSLKARLKDVDGRIAEQVAALQASFMKIESITHELKGQQALNDEFRMQAEINSASIDALQAGMQEVLSSKSEGPKFVDVDGWNAEHVKALQVSFMEIQKITDELKTQQSLNDEFRMQAEINSASIDALQDEMQEVLVSKSEISNLMIVFESLKYDCRQTINLLHDEIAGLKYYIDKEIQKVLENTEKSILQQTEFKQDAYQEPIEAPPVPFSIEDLGRREIQKRVAILGHAIEMHASSFLGHSQGDVSAADKLRTLYEGFRGCLSRLVMDSYSEREKDFLRGMTSDLIEGLNTLAEQLPQKAASQAEKWTSQAATQLEDLLQTVLRESTEGLTSGNYLELPDPLAEYIPAADENIKQVWEEYLTAFEDSQGNPLEDEDGISQALKSYVEQKVLPFILKAPEDLQRWYEQLPREKRKPQDEVEQIMEEIASAAGIEKFPNRAGNTAFSPDEHVVAEYVLVPDAPPKAIIDIVAPGYRFKNKGPIVRKALVSVNNR